MVGCPVGSAVGDRGKTCLFIIDQIILQCVSGKGHLSFLCQFCQKRQLILEGIHAAVRMLCRQEKYFAQQFNRKAAVIQCGKIYTDKSVSDILGQREVSMPVRGSAMTTPLAPASL